jgi:hypothetical protein
MATKASSSALVYQIKVSLEDVSPPIWRRLEIRDCSLTELHEIIQLSFGWENCHLYSFEIGGHEYGDPHMAYDTDLRNAHASRISDLLEMGHETFEYTYDFGDNWRHLVCIESASPAKTRVRYPRCTDGRRCGPPEDCGGPWGYEELIQSLSDPDREDRDELMEWLGGDFDPEQFDAGSLNAGLRRAT